jgi:predicted DNA-binding protein (UPF0251 family)
MAEPNDLVAEVIEAAASSDLSDLTVARRKREHTRRLEALSLRLAGLNYGQIAERMDLSEEAVRQMITRTLQRAENRLVEEEREIEGARLDRAQAAIWPDVLAGDHKAIDVYLRISARRAKLFGMDAPTKIDLSVSVRQEMEAALVNLERVVLGEVVITDAPPATDGPPADLP